MSIFDILQRCWHQIFPSACLWCSLPVSEHREQLCHYCRQALPALPYTMCHYNLLWLPAVATGLKTIRFDSLLSLTMYQDPYRHWIQQWKFYQNPAAGELLQQMFCRLLLQYQKTGVPMPQALVYVPMHSRRLRQRGFNQARLLADAAGNQLQLPVLHILKRTGHTPTQVGLSRNQRQRNLRLAFRVEDIPLPEHVALIDDVVTTGATANQLCRLLRKQGAKTISVWTLAITSAN